MWAPAWHCKPLILAATLFPGAIAIPATSRANDGCSATGVEVGVVAGVEARLELRLRDGRLVRLAGLDPALSTPSVPDRDEQARVALTGLVAGQTIGIRPLNPQPDRWGRIVALAFALEGPLADRDGGLAAAIIGNGFGRYLAEPGAHGCRSSLIAAESKARVARLGLWSDPYYGLLAIDNVADITERAGTIVVVEATLAAVKPGPYRTKLILSDRGTGSHGGQTLSASILPRTVKNFEADGVHVSSLIGQTLRLRGLLDTRFGPQIELASPDALEVTDGGLAPAAAVGSK